MIGYVKKGLSGFKIIIPGLPCRPFTFPEEGGCHILWRHEWRQCLSLPPLVLTNSIDVVVMKMFAYDKSHPENVSTLNSVLTSKKKSKLRNMTNLSLASNICLFMVRFIADKPALYRCKALCCPIQWREYRGINGIHYFSKKSTQNIQFFLVCSIS